MLPIISTCTRTVIQITMHTAHTMYHAHSQFLQCAMRWQTLSDFQVHFKKMSLQGRTERGGWVSRTDMQWERVPDVRSRKVKWTFTKGFSLDTGFVENENIWWRAQSSGWTIQGKKVRQIGRSSRVNSRETETCDFIFDSGLNREPVQSTQVRGYVICTWDFECQASSVVLKLLNAFQKSLRAAWQKGITVVNAR